VKTCLLVEDVAETRNWLEGVLGDAFEGIAVVACDSLRAAEQAIRMQATPFDLAIIDLGLPDGSGLDLVGKLRQTAPNTVCVVATIYDDDGHLFDALAAGAQGYILKDEDAEMVGALLLRIGRGEPPLSPSIARRILAHFLGGGRVVAVDDAGLTARETEVLTLIAKGLTVGEAARMLALKPQTVASYVKTIYSKLNVSTRAEATLEAVRRGLA
jgi:DNA-binding NarL/FixJ family response regulator